MNWYLRKSDSTVYGPVDESTLTTWASSGRILPDDEISTDRKAWQPAPSLASLSMEWMLELGDGERFGPLHVLALAELVRDETVLPGQPVTNTIHLNSCSLGEAVLPALLALNTPAPEPAAPVEDPELPRLRDALSKAEARVLDLESRPPPKDPELPRLSEALAKAEARIQELESRPPPPENQELVQLREALGKAAARIRELESLPPPTPPTAANLQVDGQSLDAETLLKTYRDLSHNYDRLLEQLNGKAAEFAYVLDVHATARTDLENQLAQARTLALHAQNDAESARQNLLKGEQAHLDVIKSYRDLNDRYIRLRQEFASIKPATPVPKPSDKPAVRLV